MSSRSTYFSGGVADDAQWHAWNRRHKRFLLAVLYFQVSAILVLLALLLRCVTQ